MWNKRKEIKRQLPNSDKYGLTPIMFEGMYETWDMACELICDTEKWTYYSLCMR